MLARVADANRHIGLLLVELLNSNGEHAAHQLREIGQHLGALSAECLQRHLGHHSLLSIGLRLSLRRKPGACRDLPPVLTDNFADMTTCDTPSDPAS